MNRSSRPLGRNAGRLAFAAGAILAPLGAALSQPPAPNTPGYDVERSQSVQNAPSGSVGRKTTDREHRVGNADDTRGTEVTYAMTFGGFARRCPTAEGLVDGEFEYTLTYDESSAGGAQRKHHRRQLLAQLKGQVGDDARLIDVELEGDFTTERTATATPPSSDSRHVARRFRSGAGGEPDWAALSSVAEMAGDVAAASVVLMADQIYATAQTEWLKPNECVEFSFDPPSERRALGPNEAAQVRVELRTKTGNQPVLWTSDAVGVFGGAGTVAPRSVQAAGSSPATLTYTASSQPHRGDGIEVGTLSRAGIAEARWRIAERARYEGTFTQVFNVATGAQSTTTGNLVWTPEDSEQRPAPSFGDVSSTFYRATGGDITVDIHGETTAIGGPGGCSYTSRKTFQLAELPAAARQYLVLEIAADGRYKLMLGMRDGLLLLERETVCNVPGGRNIRQTDQDNSAAIQIGIQQGVLNAEQAVAGRLAQPIRRGPATTDGEWSFRRVTQ